MDNFEMRLEQIEYEAEASKRRKDRRNRAIVEGEKTSTPPTPGKVMKNGWVMPEGWTPPGWNENKSMQAAQAFMGFKSNPK